MQSHLDIEEQSKTSYLARRQFLAFLAASPLAACQSIGHETTTAYTAYDTGSDISNASGNDNAYRVDTGWPKPLPNEWIMGDVSGVAIDRSDHIWIVHRPGTLTDYDKQAATEPPSAKCCIAAPPVLQFDAQGNLLRSWGGTQSARDWFGTEHAIYVDAQNNVWLVGAGEKDGHILKFTADGKLLLRIGSKGSFVAADDPTMLGQPTDIYVDEERRELFVSDGYRNHRIIVFDADTGAYRRQWTAYGMPVDRSYSTDLSEYSNVPPKLGVEIFGTVHCVTGIGGEILVCDRNNERIQIFSPDGKFLREIHFNPGLGGILGSVWDIAPIPGDPDRLMVLDGTNSEFAILDRHSGRVLQRYRAAGRYAGQMHWPHQIAIDRRGWVYVSEVQTGRRVQRFLPASPP